MKVVFMGTPDFAVASLRALNKAGHKISLVVTQPDRPQGRGKKILKSEVKKVAEELGLPLIQPERIKNPENVARIVAEKADVIVVAAYGQILSREILQASRLGCFNVHASLLPKYRGAAPIHRAILNGETQSGITIMAMDEGLDTGAMVKQSALAIPLEMTTGELHDCLAKMGAELLLEALTEIEAGTAKLVPQDDQEATYASMLHKEEERLDWSESAQSLHNQVRGLFPWPGAYAFFRGKRIKIGKSSFREGASQGLQTGAIARILPEQIEVATGCGYLNLLEVQPEGKKMIEIRDFVNGYGVKTGEIFD